ncbi:MAG TPA: xanthine dehydrogenase family protein subunit M [Thermodesulfobacteriota bacterium]|nr:xanthine dehydrogenase family protein subunit M [Thermodesulfobacteriota bacterium]
MLFELPSFEHVDARDVKEAASLLRKHGGRATVVAGGTDLLGLMKDRVEGPECRIPEVLVNIKKVPEMMPLSYDEKAGLRIGAGVTLRRLATSEVVQKEFKILSQAALQVGTTQLRNMGTLGGNLCQRPRCLYFRHPHFLCFKKGGNRCYAMTGEHRFYHAILKHGKCVMAHPSDLAPALIALKAEVAITGPDGSKRIPLQDFFIGPNHYTETILKADQYLTEIRVSSDNAGTPQVFLKERIRHSADFSLSSVAVVARIRGGICEDIRIVLGGVAPLPLVVFKAEDMIKGKKLDPGLISKAAEASVEGAKPLSMNGYKVDLAKALVKRALASILSHPHP